MPRDLMLPGITATRVSWDTFVARVRRLPVEQQQAIAAKAAQVVASAKPREKPASRRARRS